MKLGPILITFFTCYLLGASSFAVTAVGDLSKTWCLETENINGVLKHGSFEYVEEILPAANSNNILYRSKQGTQQPVYEYETSLKELNMALLGREIEPTDLKAWCDSKNGVIEVVQSVYGSMNACKFDMTSEGSSLHRFRWMSNKVPFGFVQDSWHNKDASQKLQATTCTLVAANRGAL